MKYDTLKALVNSKVYENTEQRITGGDMNDVLQSAIASLGAHYQMGGLVSPSDQITVGDEPVVFIATTPGTYTYFGGTVVADGEVALLVWSGTAWSKQTPDIATRTEVSQLGQVLTDLAQSGYMYAGVGSPNEDTPIIPTQKVFYIAADEGTYGSFNNLQLADGQVGIFYYDTQWRRVVPHIPSTSLTSAGYLFRGIAQPNTSYPLRNKRVFYLALTAGTYTNLGEIQLAENEVAFILGSNGSWSKSTIPLITETKASSMIDTATTNLDRVGYGVCETAEGTPAKEITTPGGVNPFVKGFRLIVRFYSGNTANGVTLNVNGTGAKDFYYNGAVVSADNHWDAQEQLDIVWNSTNKRYEAVTWNYNSNELGFSKHKVINQQALTGILQTRFENHKILGENDLEVGGFANGEDVGYSTLVRTRSGFFYPVTPGDAVLCDGETNFILAFFDENKTFVSQQSGWHKSLSIIPKSCYYIRLEFQNTNRLPVSSFYGRAVILRKDKNILRELRYSIDPYSVESPNFGEWENKYFTAQGEIGPAHSSIALCPRFFKVHKGDIVMSNVDDHRICVFEYADDSASSFIVSSGWGAYPNYLSVTLPTGYYTIQNDGYVRVQMRHTNPEDITQDIPIVANDFSAGFVIIHCNSYQHKNYTMTRNLSKKKILPRQVKLSDTIRISNDGTIIGNSLWLFGASEEYVNPDYGYDNKIQVVDLQTLSVTTKTHDFGHANCVDYNPNTDTLLATDALGYESTRGRDVYLILYKNPQQANDLSRDDAIIIPLFNQDRSRYIYAQFAFGDADDILFGFEYHYDGKTAYKLQLGMGTNDYSGDANGFGTFIQGKGDDEYNGTAKLLKTYSGKIQEGVDTEYVINSSYRTGAQGMCYDGNLFLCWGTLGGNNILEIELDDESNTYKVIHNYCPRHRASNGGVVILEPEAIAKDGNALYAGYRNANTEDYLLVKFNK